MQINKISNNSCNTSFKAGYTSQIELAERKINPQKVESFFKNSSLKDWRSFYEIDLKNNKAIALGNYLCAKIFKELRKLYDFRQDMSMQTLIYPHDIYVFDEDERTKYLKKEERSDCKLGYFVTTAGNERFVKDKPVFEPGAILIANEVNSLKSLNDSSESLYEKRELSTNHFLHNFIHEWLHAVFYNLVKSRAFIGSYSFDRTVQNYHNQQLTDREKEMVCDLISTYPTSEEHSQYTETFAESWTKFICESLSEDCTSFKKNPVDVLKSMPKEFQELLKKVTDIKMLHTFFD